MIIACPECGHKVSDKAPICPSCGVEIAGHIIKCSNCGEIYLKDEKMCPHCQYTERQIVANQTEITIEEKPKKNFNRHSHKSFFILVSIAICLGLILLFFTKTGQNIKTNKNKTAQKNNKPKLNKKIYTHHNTAKYKAKIESKKEYLVSNKADESLQEKTDTIVSKEDKESAIACLHQLLTGINNRNKSNIIEATSTPFTLQGVSGSTAQDIFKYMNDKLYQADVKTIDWRLADSDEAIFTKTVDHSIQIKIPTKLIIDREGGKGLNKYLVEATVNSGKITQISWN